MPLSCPFDLNHSDPSRRCIAWASAASTLRLRGYTVGSRSKHCLKCPGGGGGGGEDGALRQLLFSGNQRPREVEVLGMRGDNCAEKPLPSGGSLTTVQTREAFAYGYSKTIEKN